VRDTNGFVFLVFEDMKMEEEREDGDDSMSGGIFILGTHLASPRLFVSR